MAHMLHLHKSVMTLQFVYCLLIATVTVSCQRTQTTITKTKLIENILFRSSQGEGYRGYLQTSDTRPITVFCEATSQYIVSSYNITVSVLCHRPVDCTAATVCVQL